PSCLRSLLSLFVFSLSLFVFIGISPIAIYPLSLHDALPIFLYHVIIQVFYFFVQSQTSSILIILIKSLLLFIISYLLYIINNHRSEEHTSELQSRFDLVCRLLL